VFGAIVCPGLPFVFTVLVVAAAGLSLLLDVVSRRLPEFKCVKNCACKAVSVAHSISCRSAAALFPVLMPVLSICIVACFCTAGNAPGAWHTFNDDKRKGTTFEEVSQKPASLLFYSRQQPRQEPLLPPAANHPSSSPTAHPPSLNSQILQCSKDSSVAGSAGSASTAFCPSLSADGNAEAPSLDNHLTAGRLQPGCSAGSETGGITEPSGSDVPCDQLHSCAPHHTCTDAVLKRQPSPAESDHSDQSVQASASHPAGLVLPSKGHMQMQSTGKLFNQAEMHQIEPVISLVVVYDQMLFLQSMQLHHAHPCCLYLCGSNLFSPLASLQL